MVLPFSKCPETIFLFEGFKLKRRKKFKVNRGRVVLNFGGVIDNFESTRGENEKGT